MAIIAHPLTAIDGSPVYTAQDYRFAVNPFLTASPAASSPFACYQGVRAGAAVPLASLDLLTVTVHPHAGILCPWSNGGAYSYAVTQDTTIQIASSQGEYKVAVVLTDPSAGHGDTPGAVLKVFDGTTPDNSIPGLVLASVSDGVVSDQAPVLNADGSIAVKSNTALDALTALDGQAAYVGSDEYRRIGGEWIAEHAEGSAGMPYGAPHGIKLYRDHNTVIATGHVSVTSGNGFKNSYNLLVNETIPVGFRPKPGSHGTIQGVAHGNDTHFWMDVNSSGVIHVFGTFATGLEYGYVGVWVTD